MINKSTHTQSSGKSPSQSAESLMKENEQLKQELAFQNYQASLSDDKLFRDILMRQLQVINQSLLSIKAEIVTASSEEESKDNRLNEEPEQEEEETEDTDEDDDELEFEPPVKKKK